MSIQGIIFIDILGLGFLILIINLVRTHRLYVGYGIIWLLAVTGLMVLVSLQPLLAFITAFVGARFPASTLSLLAFVFIFGVLIFFSIQLSQISARQIDIIQSMAINERLEQEEKAENKERQDS
ncbi:MAG TPA: DUF2304 domain-containing protein [Anaerolineales bacterium]|jgi:hypothetical protein|nr:DUF2304 domain-containing protein [Anaerolineales bacterium]